LSADTFVDNRADTREKVKNVLKSFKREIEHAINEGEVIKLDTKPGTRVFVMLTNRVRTRFIYYVSRIGAITMRHPNIFMDAELDDYSECIVKRYGDEVIHCA